MPNKLYVNGDSHIACTYKDWGSHNHEKSFAGLLAKKHSLDYTNHGFAGGSNPRIIRTSKQHLEDADSSNTVVLIQWSNTARTEWLVDGKWYQVADQDNYEILDNPYLNKVWRAYFDSLWKKECDYVMLNRAIEQQYHILEFSNWLTHRNFKHIFLHGNGSFFTKRSPFEIKWPNGIWLYDKPYDSNLSFCDHSLRKGHQADHWSHFGPEAHQDYADFIELEFKRILDV
jgi:hypothetical protein